MTGGIDRSAYMGPFRDEMLEHLQFLTEQFLMLEAHPDDADVVAEAFRRAHTVKGSARMMGFAAVSDIAHSVEDVLDDLRTGRARASHHMLDAMLSAVDLLRELVNSSPEESTGRPDVQAILGWLRDLRPGSSAESSRVRLPEVSSNASHEIPQTAPQPVQQPGESAATPPSSEQHAHLPSPSPASRSDAGPRETVRVDVKRIDQILNLAGELMVAEAARKQVSADFLSGLGLVDAVEAAAQAGDLERTLAQIQGLKQGAAKAAKQFRRIASIEAEVSQELHYQVSTLRMLPVRSVFGQLPRAARDVAREGGKEAEVILDGEDTEIDREVLERVRDSLLHLVRNAVAHGIEVPAVRVAAGKAPVGRVRVTAQTRGEMAIIVVEDDGIGVDVDAVTGAALRKGIATAADIDAMNNTERLQLVFRPGLTTNLEVNETAGRGVGLDVVRAGIDAMKGRVELQTIRGRGTKVTLELPVTLAYSHLLLIQVSRSTYGIPCAATHGIAEVRPDSLVTLQGRNAVEVGGQMLPFVWMHEVLGLEPNGMRKATRWPVLLLGSRESPIAFAVDGVIGDENAIVKPLGPLVRQSPNVAGGIILGDGRVALVLSAVALADEARGSDKREYSRAQSRRVRQTRRVLVVDDAAITRELERGILEAAGYQVETAVDGQDALAKLRSRDFSLVVADVEMPRMTGLQLAAAIRSDLKLANLPIVIVSSRESDDDKRRGMQLGIQAYLGKGAFDQTDLLDTIESLIG